ncbi:MAG: hypothetical protein E3K32_09800 [wastewater metagenome]|nr:hypothetical protein [Candidatus Loosdrechtia aerotolerans]
MRSLEHNRNTVISGLTIATFATLPLYLFQSGGFQIVDAIIILLSAALFITITYCEVQTGLYLIGPFIPFISWVVIVNSYYATEAISETGYLLSTAQLIFGFYVLFLFSIAFKRILSNLWGISCLYWGLLASCLTPWLMRANSKTLRSALSFNNPNQLAYYSILILSMLLFVNLLNTKTRRKSIVHWILNITIIIICNIFVLVSASRAGTVVVILLDICLLYILLKEYIKLFVSLAVMLVFLSVTLSVVSKHYGAVFTPRSQNTTEIKDTTQMSRIEAINYRFSRGGNVIEVLGKRVSYIQNDDTFSILFGNGGRKFVRQKEKSIEDLSMREVHNAPVEIYDSYGIVGAVLFLGGSVFFVMRLGTFPSKWLFFITLLLYNISHNGIRFRSMWVAIALVSIVSLLKKDQLSTQYQFTKLRPVDYTR